MVLELLSVHEKVNLLGSGSLSYFLRTLLDPTRPLLHRILFCPLLSPFLSLWEGGRLSIASSLIMKEIEEGQR